MELGGSRSVDAQLDHRNFCVGVRVLQHRPGAMIESPRIIEPYLDGVEQLAHARGKPWIARRRVLDVEQRLREAVEIVDRFRLFHRGHRGSLRVPVRRDAKDRFGPRDGLAELSPGLGVLVALERVHRAAVPKKHHWHSGVGFRHRGLYARSKAHSRMPVVFFGHGSPMNTLERNKYTETWRKLSESIPRPKAILCVSAHWYTEGTAVTAMEKPKTIHDFYGFPQTLFDVQYPAPGDPRLAARVRELLEPAEIRLDDSWGFDHGTWSVLKHAYPDAKIPVVQLSIDGTRAPEFHYEAGKRLAPLRDESVLVAGSGNVVHNLRLMKRGGGSPFDWAVRFNERVREALASRDHQALIEFERLGGDACLAVPTPEHYLPLLYIAAL